MKCPECGFEVIKDDIFCPNCAAMLHFEEVVAEKEKEIEDQQQKAEAEKVKQEQEALRKAEEQKKKEQEAEKKKQLEQQKKAEAEKKRQYETQKAQKLAAKKQAAEKRQDILSSLIAFGPVVLGIIGVIAGIILGVKEYQVYSDIAYLVGFANLTLFFTFLTVAAFSSGETGWGVAGVSIDLIFGVFTVLFGIALFVWDLPGEKEAKIEAKAQTLQNAYIVSYQEQAENRTLAVLSNGVFARSKGNSVTLELTGLTYNLKGNTLKLSLGCIANPTAFDTANLQIEVGLYYSKDASSFIWRKAFDKEGLKAESSLENLTLTANIPAFVRNGQYYAGVVVKEFTTDRYYDAVTECYWSDEPLQFTNKKFEEGSSSETLQIAETIEQKNHQVAKMSDGTYMLLSGKSTEIMSDALSYSYDGKKITVSYNAITNTSPWRTAQLSCVVGLIKKEDYTGSGQLNSFQRRLNLGCLEEGYHFTENSKTVEIPQDLPAGEYYVTFSVDEQWLLNGWEKCYTTVFDKTIRIGNFTF